MKIYYSTAIILATLALSACGSDSNNSADSNDSINEDVTVLKRGSGQPCPDFSGYYICEDTINGEKQEPVKEKVVMEQGENHEISFQEIKMGDTNPLDMAISSVIAPGGKITLIADGEIHNAPGSEITKMLGGVEMKYSVNCNANQFSFHFFMDKDNTSKVIMTKNIDGSITGKSIELVEGEKTISEGTCEPISEAEYLDGLPDNTTTTGDSNTNGDSEDNNDNDPLGWLWYILGLN